ncbi:MAG: TonB-dependent receptor, partial [Gammaproteobacteria bacterium]|nr:TonB-dependent receptor [Gammaproteobacteria bacterium]
FAHQVRFPTLRDLYQIGLGNPELLPETTDNIEMAVQRDFMQGRSGIEFVLYRVDAEDFIERGVSGLAENFASLRFQGVELNGHYGNGENLELKLGYTFLDAENRDPNAETDAVQQRPRHKFSARLDYDFDIGTRLYASWMYVADSLTLSRTTPVETTELGDYNVLDLGVSHPLFDDRVWLIGRVENLLDENYQEAYGFPQPGRRFYLGAEMRL